MKVAQALVFWEILLFGDRWFGLTEWRVVEDE